MNCSRSKTLLNHKGLFLFLRQEFDNGKQRARLSVIGFCTFARQFMWICASVCVCASVCAFLCELVCVGLCVILCVSLRHFVCVFASVYVYVYASVWWVCASVCASVVHGWYKGQNEYQRPIFLLIV